MASATVAPRKYEEHGEYLGNGAFGSVTAVKRISDNKVVARKTIRCDAGSQSEIDAAHREIDLLKRLKNYFVLDYLDSELHDNKFMRIYTEYCSRGDLSQVIGDIKRGEGDPCFRDEQFLIDITWQLSAALMYLHRGLTCKLVGGYSEGKCEWGVEKDWSPILHRDIKPSNVFLQCTRDPTNYIVKLGDFGAGFLMSTTAKDPSTWTGTKTYWAPEIVEQASQSEDSRITTWSQASDIYAAGRTILAVCLLNFPRATINILQRASRDQIFEKIPEDSGPAPSFLMRGLHGCVMKRPSSRSIFQCLAAYFFKDFNLQTSNPFKRSLWIPLNITPRKILNLAMPDHLESAMLDLLVPRPLSHLAAYLTGFRGKYSLENLSRKPLKEWNSQSWEWLLSLRNVLASGALGGLVSHDTRAMDAYYDYGICFHRRLVEHQLEDEPRRMLASSIMGNVGNYSVMDDAAAFLERAVNKGDVSAVMWLLDEAKISPAKALRIKVNGAPALYHTLEECDNPVDVNKARDLLWAAISRADEDRTLTN